MSSDLKHTWHKIQSKLQAKEKQDLQNFIQIVESTVNSPGFKVDIIKNREASIKTSDPSDGFISKNYFRSWKTYACLSLKTRKILDISKQRNDSNLTFLSWIISTIHQNIDVKSVIGIKSIIYSLNQYSAQTSS